MPSMTQAEFCTPKKHAKAVKRSIQFTAKKYDYITFSIINDRPLNSVVNKCDSEKNSDGIIICEN
jgi:hypothetical protein